MDPKNQARKKRMKANALPFQQVNPSDLLSHLQCLPTPRQQRVKCVQDRHGPIAAADLLLETLTNYDDWFDQLIPGLRELGHNDLADRLDDPAVMVPDDRSPHRPKNGPQSRSAPDSSGARSKQKSTVEAEARVHLPEAKPCHKRATPSPSTTGSTQRYHRSSHFSELPSVILQVLRRLDEPSPAFGRDWMGLAGQLGFSVGDVNSVQAGSGSPTHALLKEWSTQPEATVGKLLQSLLAMDRRDVCQALTNHLGLQSEELEVQLVASSNPIQGGACRDEWTPHQKEEGIEAGPGASRPHPGATAKETRRPEPACPESDPKPANDELIKASDSAAPGPEMKEASRPKAEASLKPEALVDAKAASQEHDGPLEYLDTGAGTGVSCQGTESKNQKIEVGTSGVIVEPPVGKDRKVSPNPCQRAVPVMNDLNRSRLEAGPSGSTSPDRFEVNCTGRTLLSQDRGWSSSENPAYDSREEGSTFYGLHTPDDLIGPLRTDTSLDGEIELEMSENSCSTLASVITAAAGGVGAGTDGVGSAETASEDATETALAGTACPMPAPAPSNTRLSSKGIPVEHPSEKLRPEGRLISSIDRTFSQDELIRAANPRCPSQLVSGQPPYFGVQSQSESNCPDPVRLDHQEVLTDAGVTQIKRSIPLSSPDSLEGKVTGGCTKVTGMNRDQPLHVTQPTSSQNCQESLTSLPEAQKLLFSAPKGPSDQQLGYPDAESTLCAANVMDSQIPPTHEALSQTSVGRSSSQPSSSNSFGGESVEATSPQHDVPGDPTAQCNPPDAQSPASDARAGAQSPPPPTQEDPEPLGAEAPDQPSAEDVAGQAPEPNAQRGSLALAIPLMLSLGSAFLGGDLLPNTTS